MDSLLLALLSWPGSLGLNRRSKVCLFLVGARGISTETYSLKRTMHLIDTSLFTSFSAPSNLEATVDSFYCDLFCSPGGFFEQGQK